LALGIGDDCAVLRVEPGSDLLVTTDMCVEDIHFKRAWHTARSVGHRCLLRGLSDIAAMGGTPTACFLSLGLSETLSAKWANDFIAGLLGLAGKFNVALAGGDTTKSEKVTADIVVLGKVPSGRAVSRSRARPGDKIYVTGMLGGSAWLLKRLMAGESVSRLSVQRQFCLLPRLAVGDWLRERGVPTAMIDLSDGLSVDLAHICKESNVAAELWSGAIPVERGATLEMALHGGEDYELLFTAPAKIRVPPRIEGVPVSSIGEIRPAPNKAARVLIGEQGGKLRPLPPRGWEHFSKRN